MGLGRLSGVGGTTVEGVDCAFGSRISSHKSNQSKQVWSLERQYSGFGQE